MESNDINLNSINEQSINNNIINEHPQQNNNYNQAELITTTEKLVKDYWYYKSDNVNQEIRNYLNNIREFYNSNDTNILQKLTSIVHNTMNNNSNYLVKTNIVHNLKKLQERGVITADKHEDLLIFSLFLNTMANIEHTGEKVWLKKSNHKWVMHNTPINIDGKQWWIHKWDIKGTNYEQLLDGDNEFIIDKLTELLIKKYFVLDNPDTWIAKDRLIAKIEDNIRNTCDVLDNLPIAKQLLNNKNTTTYEKIQKYMHRVSNKIDKYFDKTEVKDRLVRELKNVFKESQWNKMHKKTGINSKYILQNIGKYIQDNELLKELARYQAFPEELFDDPKGIPAIVLSYLKSQLEDGKTWIVPDPIYSYMKEYNIINEQQNSEDEDPFKDNSEYDERD